MKKKQSSISFGKRMQNFLKEGNVTKGNKFYKKVSDVIDNRIFLLEKEIAETKEKLTEFEEIYENEIFKISPENINTVSNRINYAKTYVEHLCNFKFYYKLNNVSFYKMEEILNIKKKELENITNLKEDLQSIEPNVEEEED